MVLARFGALLLLCLLASCKTEALPGEPPVAGDWYLATLDFGSYGAVPFFLQLPPPGRSGPAVVLNTEDATEFGAVWKGDQVTATGPWNYLSTIIAKRDPSGTLVGTWTRNTPLWGTVVRSLHATRIEKPDPALRFASTVAPEASVVGIWRFQFATHEEGKGVFEQNSQGLVRGFVRPGELGDLRLSGAMHGRKLALAMFNGNVANLLVAEVSPDGTSMTGVMSLQNVWNEKFTARRAEDFDIKTKVHVKEGHQTVSLRGLDKYRGRPTVAMIFATWCSSCNDAAPYLAQLYAKYQPRGLSMLGVAYDLSPDEKVNLAELDYFRRKYKIPWELIQVPSTPETWVSTMPPELEGWDGVPILLLIRPDGTVQSVFGGWFSGTGTDSQKRRREFEAAVDALVAASPSLDSELR
jgi:thiol-disulfide isomerase/thioredoxin